MLQNYKISRGIIAGQHILRMLLVLRTQHCNTPAGTNAGKTVDLQVVSPVEVIHKPSTSVCPGASIRKAGQSLSSSQNFSRLDKFDITNEACAGVVGHEALTPDENRPVSIMPKKSPKKRKRQLKFDNSMKENYTPSPSQIKEGTSGRLSELLTAEAEKRVEHYKNLCREDEERHSSNREKDELEKKLLREKLEKEELEKILLKIKIRLEKRKLEGIYIRF